MTLKDLAKLAGVSVSTVSKVMSDSSEISAKTKSRVLKIAKEHGCYERLYKGKYEKTVIGIVVPEFSSEYYTAMADYLMRNIEQRGAMAILAQTGFSDSKCKDFAEYFYGICKVDGIIVICEALGIKKTNIPMVVIEGRHGGVDTVYIDYASAINDAVRYLKDCGHSRIAFIGETKTSSKLEMFKKAMNANHLMTEQRYISISSKRFEAAGYHAMEQVYNQTPPPTAVFAAYDYIAIGAITYLKSINKQVPDDISIIGMNDIAAAAYNDISLTSIGVDYDLLCSEACDLLMRRIKTPYYVSYREIKIKCTLEQRASVKKINKAPI